MKKLYRSKHNRMVSGILGGLEDYFGVDATLLRLAFVFFVICTGIFPGVIAYLIGIMIIPEQL